MNAPDAKTKMIIQFDGHCILCSRTIQFILKADRHKKFLFQTIQSVPANNDAGESVIVKDGKLLYTHFEAILKIGKELGGLYRLIEITRVLPEKWRYRLYEWVARNRYRWFGRKETCFLPTAEERERFV